MFFLKVSLLLAFIALVVGLAPTFLEFSISNARPVQVNISEPLANFNNDVKYVITEKGKIQVYLADTEEKRSKGLGGLPSIPQDYGMFFIFDSPDYFSLWMKDVFFPIDMIWIDENFNIVHIEKDISPNTFPSIFTAPVKALYVLEMNAGMSEFYRLKTGGRIIFK